MSSGTFVITVMDRPTEHWSIWRVRNTTAGGANDYVSTRSFALSAMAEYISGLESEYLYDDWFKNNVDKHIEYVTFLAEVNIQPNGNWPQDTDQKMDVKYKSDREREDELAKEFHHVYLAVFVKDASYLDQIPEVFGTTAFDWWWDDPTRNPTPEFGPSFNYEKLIGFCNEIKEGKYP
jgi:hypothetical protein